MSVSALKSFPSLKKKKNYLEHFLVSLLLCFLGCFPKGKRVNFSFPSPLGSRIVNLGLQPSVVKEYVNEDFQRPEKTVKRKRNNSKSWEGISTVVPHERAGYHKEGILWICISCLSLWGLSSTVGEGISVGCCLMLTPNRDTELC